jgi:metal transporter CNNM
MPPFVLGLMYILAPVAWPTAKLLDYLLGEDHGTVYKKAGLKTLVSLHKSMGEGDHQLNTDEVTIISAVLDLKDKPVGIIMTPMDDVFTLSLDDILDEDTMDDILSRGYSRIPIHHPDNDKNFVGMLLVKMLITYDPEDAKPVRDFALATLPETGPDTSCLDIINYFQEGNSHMILLSEFPGEDHGAIGVVTLEDVIEELIGEEIVDESDVFVDVHKAIRRAMPAHHMRIPRGHIVEEPPSANTPGGDLVDITENETLSPADLQRSSTADAKPKLSAYTTRRRSSANSNQEARLPKRAATDELKEHLKHIGPSNLASRPKTTRFNTVKIKPGSVSDAPQNGVTNGRMTPARRISESTSEYQKGIGQGVLRSGGKQASDAVQVLHQEGYGTTSGSPVEKRPVSANKGVQADPSDLRAPEIHADDDKEDSTPTRPPIKTTDSQSTIGSLQESRQRSRSPFYKSKGPARSGSITENVIDSNGIRKVVLETTSSSESNEDEDNSGANKPWKRQNGHPDTSGGNKSSGLRGGGSEDGQHAHHQTKNKRRRRKKQQGHDNGERAPLLGHR